MAGVPVVRNKPEEEELVKKQAELSEVESRLIDRELFLTTLRAELSAFERVYVSRLGIRYAELDEIEAKIAETIARLRPTDDCSRKAAAQTRSQADASKAVVDKSLRVRTAHPAYTSRLKSLYREVAKRIHPDLASDDADRLRRQGLMGEANKAYEEGDEVRLKAILDEYESSPETVIGEGAGAELVRVIRKIAQVQRRLQEIGHEIKALENSQWFSLRAKVEQASKEGRDLLREMAEELDSKIATSRTRLKDFTARQGRAWNAGTI